MSIEINPALAPSAFVSILRVTTTSLLNSIPIRMSLRGEVEGVATVERGMGGVRYAIAGDPVDHSLSPLLLNLVHARLLDLLGKRDLNLDLKRTDLVSTALIEDALAWGYAGSAPNAPTWAYTNAPFGKFRTTTLLAKAVEAGMAVEDADDRFSPIGEEDVSVRKTSVNSPSDLPLPTGFLTTEIWVNLTAPLKHQLSSTAVSAIDSSMEYQCCLLYTSPSPRDATLSRMPSSA